MITFKIYFLSHFQICNKMVSLLLMLFIFIYWIISTFNFFKPPHPHNINRPSAQPLPPHYGHLASLQLQDAMLCSPLLDALPRPWVLAHLLSRLCIWSPLPYSQAREAGTGCSHVAALPSHICLLTSSSMCASHLTDNFFEMSLQISSPLGMFNPAHPSSAIQCWAAPCHPMCPTSWLCSGTVNKGTHHGATLLHPVWI